MSYIDELVAAGKEKLGKDGKDALAFLKSHRKELEGVGKDLLEKIVAHVALGEVEVAKDLYLIKYQTNEELIKGVESSGDVFIKSHQKMMAEREKINAMWMKLGKEIAAKLLPLIVTLL